MGKIILASSSPRRSSILKNMNLDFDVIPSEYEESHTQTDFSYDFVESLAYNKALDVAQKLHSVGKCHLVIGADTIVSINNKIIGKPQNFEDAFSMLSELSGEKHFVVTSVAIIDSKDMRYKIESDTTYVTFYKLSEELITNYIKKFKPYDKAGSYGIQELPDGFVRKVEGDIDNVIGLPSKIVNEIINTF